MNFKNIEQNIQTNHFRQWLNSLLFDLQSPLGRNANLFAMLIILLSVLLSMIGTIEEIPAQAKNSIRLVEVIVTLAFLLEYVGRIYAGRWPLAYIFSVYGFIDLLTWLPLLLFGDTYLALRLLRVLRLLKLLRYLKSMRIFFASMLDIFDTIFMVLASTFIIVLVSGNFIHYLEPDTFDNAFLGCWWSIVTMTTVGYGDMVPQTMGGKAAAAMLMFLGITMFALLTGSITVKLNEFIQTKKDCLNCQRAIPLDGIYCPYCGNIQNTKNRVDESE
jgi:voltage-gated potassium channel